MFLYRLSGDHEALAQHEAQAVHKCRLVPHGEHLYSANNFAYKNLALTKYVIKVLASDTAKEALIRLGLFKMGIKENKSFKVVKVGQSPFSEKDIANALKTDCHVNLEHPDITYYCVFLESQFYFGELVWENTDDFESRKAHNRPRLHPSSMHPKIAKAMINMALADVICDPFCGSGGLLIEGCLLGKKMHGIDLVPSMLERAHENLVFFGCKNFTLEQNDSIFYNGSITTIVTDVPFGKNTVAHDIQKLYHEFLTSYNHFAKRMVVSFPSHVDIAQDILLWEIEFSYTYRLHQSLSRTIYVLNKKS